MSWKSLVSAGLLCVVASPVFAAPSLQVTNGGLDASGNWIWNVSITPTAASTPLAAELGFRETQTGSQIINPPLPVINATDWDTVNPGTKIFGWETEVDVDPGPGVNMKPEGLQVNNATDEIFLAYGSRDLPVGTPSQVLTIKTLGPTSTSLATRTASLQVLGKYGTGAVNGRIAEITGGPALNYSNFAGTATRVVVAGDANLLNDGAAGAAVSVNDLAILAASLNRPATNPRFWQHGDFNGLADGAGGAEVSVNDLAILAACLNRTTPACTGSNTPLNVTGVAGGGGASLGGGSAVPEPASVALAGLALLGGLGLIRRRQK